MNEASQDLDWLIIAYVVGNFTSYEKKHQSEQYKTILWFICHDADKAKQSAKNMINKDREFLARTQKYSIEDFKKSKDFEKFSKKHLEAIEYAITNKVSDYYITSDIVPGLP